MSVKIDWDSFLAGWVSGIICLRVLIAIFGVFDMVAKSPERKVIETIANAFDRNSFAPEYFGRRLAQELSGPSQRILFRVFGAAIAVWSERFDSDACYDDDDINLCAYAKRVDESLVRY